MIEADVTMFLFQFWYALLLPISFWFSILVLGKFLKPNEN